MIQVVLLGTGTPNAEPWACFPAYALICSHKTYLVDCGPGVVRQCTKGFYQGIEDVKPQKLGHVFLTHLHSDHCAGLAEVILMPWVLEREMPLHVYGPAGTCQMCHHLLKAYRIDTSFRDDGPEPINKTGLETIPHEIKEGTVYQDENLRVEAFRVSHGSLESYAYVFYAEDKKIVFSGDTCPVDIMQKIAKDADLLIHECEYTAGIKERTVPWQKYHQSMHTMSIDLAGCINQAKPKLTVTTHRILHLNYYEIPVNMEEVRRREDALLKEITDLTSYKVVNGHDLDVFTLK